MGSAAIVRSAWIGNAPVFSMLDLASPSPAAFCACLAIAALLGVAAFGISRSVFLIEDAFEKLPFHWMWWPAVGGVAVGIIGCFEPRTLGVGYENITTNLAGSAAFGAVLALCALKYLSWSIALGSGTSGGTLAPLLTIGSALGWILGVSAQKIVPGLDPHLAALIGMACLFGGASQAMLAAAVFAFETTGQSTVLAPLLACSAVAVWVARLLGRTSIMTEKIARRGVSVPSQFSVDLFEHTAVEKVMDRNPVTLSPRFPFEKLVRQIAAHDPELGLHHAHPVLDENGRLQGIITRGDVIRAIETASPEASVGDIATPHPISVFPTDTLHDAMGKMLRHDVGRLPVVAREDPGILLGYLSRRAILSARATLLDEETPDAAWRPWQRAPAPGNGTAGKN